MSFIKNMKKMMKNIEKVLAYPKASLYVVISSLRVVTKVASIRFLIAITTIHNLLIHWMNVKMAFLHGDLEEEIYMDQPDGFTCLVTNTRYVNN